MRGLSGGQTTALTAGNFAGIAFVQLDFTSPLYLSTLPYAFDWNGHNWLGAGNLGSISAVQENSDLQAQGVNLTLAGLDPSIIATAIGEQYQGKRCQIWFCPLDEDGQLIGTPLRIFNGRIDTMSIETGETSSITLAAESALVDFFRARVSRFNHADQQSKYPTDMGFQYVAEMVQKEIKWGRE
ncbi:MAG TPA: hypothetical protein VJ654_03055 [Noviherbaspirillum sp.]|nr:hypothetical protein [Noviherbaspirillum sp.]